MRYWYGLWVGLKRVSIFAEMQRANTHILTVLIAVFTVGSAYSQTASLAKDTVPTVVKDSTVTRITLEPGIQFVLDLYDKAYEFKGYRVQIYSGPNKKEAKQVRARFLQRYRDVKTHQTFDAPNFKIRVGDFETRLEAVKLRNEIREHFPNCYIVPDVLEVSNIGKDKKEEEKKLEEIPAPTPEEELK